MSHATPGPSYSHASTRTSTALPSLCHPEFQGHLDQLSHPSTDNQKLRTSSDSIAVPQNNDTTSESPPQVAPPPDPSEPPPSVKKVSINFSKKKAESTWSVEYHPEAKRVLDLHLDKVIRYEASIYCVEVSPDGHRFAIGLSNGTTYLKELETGSNIWLVSNRFV